jgi:hypothetical protein
MVRTHRPPTTLALCSSKSLIASCCHAQQPKQGEYTHRFWIQYQLPYWAKASSAICVLQQETKGHISVQTLPPLQHTESLINIISRQLTVHRALALPISAAWCSAVAPILDAREGLAPWSSRYSAVCSRPCRATWKNIVLPENSLEFHRNITDQKNKKIKQGSNTAPAIQQRGTIGSHLYS